ncbi:MAG: GntR family transcriptional regulator [Dethiobacteria bacterium]|nr:GntR family transcriptional regulator [Bacillota bacterium]NMD34146.1 GntR family transcriptional regulator [Bacillota bacterium]HOB29747.1 GntR family transcriptional regulator [Bacillota bacterium]HPZ41199.1 GntR family transcriptional regulator [Bacillota bacterium]HQD52793.1 GntR family transcriptional regulator [Bacillota bacterium]
MPIYYQLVEQIRNAIAGGMLKPGQQLPSVRELAGKLAINPNTVTRAYGILESEGLLIRRQGTGTFVAQITTPPRDLSRLEQSLDQIVAEAYHLRLSPTDLRRLLEKAIERWNRKEGE